MSQLRDLGLGGRLPRLRSSRRGHHDANVQKDQCHICDGEGASCLLLVFLDRRDQCRRACGSAEQGLERLFIRPSRDPFFLSARDVIARSLNFPGATGLLLAVTRLQLAGVWPRALGQD